MMLLSCGLLYLFFTFISQIESTEKCDYSKVKKFLGEEKTIPLEEIAGTSYYAVSSTRFPNIDKISSVKVHHSKIMNDTSSITSTQYEIDGKIVSQMKFLATNRLGKKDLPYYLTEDFTALYVIECVGELVAEYTCQKSGGSVPFATIGIFAPISIKDVCKEDLHECKVKIQERMEEDCSFTDFEYPPEFESHSY